MVEIYPPGTPKTFPILNDQKLGILLTNSGSLNSRLANFKYFSAWHERPTAVHRA